MTNHDLLTVRDACKQLSVGRSMLEGLFRSGKLTKVKLGSRTVRVAQHDLDRYIEQSRQQSPSVQDSVSRAFDADAQFSGDNPFA